MLISYLALFIGGTLLGMLFLWILKKMSLRYALLIHQGMPLVGGLSMGISFAITCLLGALFCGLLSPEISGIIFTSSIMLVFGIADDWKELSVVAKFLVQIIATSFLVYFGIRTHIVFINKQLNIFLTFIWVLGITNAFNHLDILDGLAAGIAGIVSASFFIISFLNHSYATAILSLTLTGAIFGFLIYNLPPARVYMGNAGSHFLGFALASIALLISYAPLQREVALLTPLFILGFPIFDTAFLILMRLIKKNLPFRKSNDHLALRFLALGYSKKKALVVMLAWSIFFSLCGILLSQVSNSFGTVIIIFVILALFSLTKKMSRVVA